MLKLGKSQKCKILREKDFGVFVGQEGEEGILLPIRSSCIRIPRTGSSLPRKNLI